MRALSPLLVADDLRVDIDGIPACDGISFRSTGVRLLVLGAPRALFEATTGLASVVRGTLAVRGEPAANAAALGRLAGAPSDPPLPPGWTTLDYVRWNARLGGVPRGEARAKAEAAIEKLQLGSMKKTLLSLLPAHARRAAVVAGALSTGASILVLDDPLAGLSDEIAVPYGRILAQALADLEWIVFASRMPLASPLTLLADEAIVATAMRVDAQGTPAELAAAPRRFVGRLEGAPPAVAAIAPLLAERGAMIEAHGAHVSFHLGADMTTSELMAICDRAGVAVLELLPVARALS
jgi:ABC-type multidrug transport system ATPase subunit